MRLWRVFDHTTPWARAKGFDPLDGTGGLYAASRWNNKGTPVVYLAASPSLAILETLAHVSPTEFGERKLLELELRITSTRRSQNSLIEPVSQALFLQLLRDAPKSNPEKLTREYGSRWASEGRSLLLQVPSMVVPFEHNHVFNPQHKDAAKIKVVREDIARLDRRILSQD